MVLGPGTTVRTIVYSYLNVGKRKEAARREAGAKKGVRRYCLAVVACAVLPQFQKQRERNGVTSGALDKSRGKGSVETADVAQGRIA